MKLRKLMPLVLAAAFFFAGCSTGQPDNQAAQQSSLQTTVSRLAQTNKNTAAKIKDQAESMSLDKEVISELEKKLNKQPAAPKQESAKPTAAASSTAAPDLAKLNYSGTPEITVNNNDPGFSASDQSTAKGGWESYADLDNLNRAQTANALLNRSLMPTSKRTALTWDPTGWRNKRTAHGWLYNRSHLIGFQLSGENNNPKNLITGTQSLNNPHMLAHEMDIAYYLKQSNQHFIRYQVKPVYQGNELVARGVQMRAQSVGDNTVRFNVYIFNVEPGYTINYTDGTSVKG
ncbi:DNA/RNA non-specific endonuclease [Schleiferilactobacillus harbinensis]|jgi:DNA-entry nuclease|uniref:DNA/RNA non-specific endonuclease n=1 Tax=Schleiferilactobacillus harbinensis TaxID=304207 RepID=UPI00242EE7D1|nr:DNA/RNA non-specific endonuclease [Schleiferilactobacillus harbinensis]MCI1851936.1 DNA/RNA non-specific endonuclease [Schleiferilactobacillus harbinensis]